MAQGRNNGRAAARKGKTAAQRKLEKKRDETLGHIQAIDAESQRVAQAAEAQLASLRDAKSQMVGRLRLIAEDLGEVAPLLPPAPVEQITEESAAEPATV